MSARYDLEQIAVSLRNHVSQLAADIGERNVYRPAALHAAEQYIRQSWAEMNYEVQAQEYEVEGVRCANLETSVRGNRYPDQILLIGAHYDSVYGSPGANDNASGVAALLELSRLFQSASPSRSLRFVAFVNEEPPFFLSHQQGSMRYAREARRRGDDIRLMLALETIGYYRDERGSQRYPPLFRYFYPDRGNFIAFVSNLKSRRQLRRLAAAFRACSDVPIQQAATFAWVPGVGWSDHHSFWQHGFPAVMVTDTALYRYPYYHSADDTPEKLDYETLAAVTLGLYRAWATLADEKL